ncbi:MAG TPA: 3-hydroxyacyl-CoA dehydrogenase NAD-binding domain-containing protein [Rubrivivax sp.]|nr:3-hydroxyacyl-CoA dehydrogenase NAD-binding domain-containing protein [Rubrivivax sp.]
MQRIVVAGPGLMGLGIAQVAAAAGVEVRLLGRDAAAGEAACRRLAGALQRQVARGRIDGASAERLLGRIAPVADETELARCDGAIESVPEDRALKLAVLARLEAALPAGALIATNTSGLPVGGLARALARPDRFVGLHFFSPVERMKLVEVVRGEATSDATLADALAFVRRLGQVPVVVRDGPGFFTSRVFAAYLDEAIALVGEGVAPQAVDAAARALGRAVGPLALLDDISLALNLQQAQQARADGMPPQRCRPLAEPVLAAMVGAGRKGRRDGGGFYDTAADGTRTPWAGLAALFPPAGHPPAAEAIGQRLRVAEVMEALRCLEGGVVASADDADTASVLGLAWPRAEGGGVLGWAERCGLPPLVAAADALAAVLGPRFRPSPWLRERAAAGDGLHRWRAAPILTPAPAPNPPPTSSDSPTPRTSTP